LPLGTIEAASTVAHWVCENAKSLRALLKRVDAVVPLAMPLQQVHITELPRWVHKKGDHVGGSAAAIDRAWLDAALAPAQAGGTVALVSEAGLPCVADPGSSVVRAAHDRGLAVQALAGSTSLMQALACSGLNGQHFAFVGYLPTDAAERTKRIAQLEAIALRDGQTQICIETQYRNQAVMDALLRGLKPQTRLCVAQGLLTGQDSVRSKTVAQWRSSGMNLLGLPTVYLFGQ
jgi:16S rRNA (cytidine1402-2'-O)-methyltransferase